MSELKQTIIDVLREVYDPEIPINIYDLGLIYDITVTKTHDVHILMTLTSPSCPTADYIIEMVKDAVGEVGGVGKVEVELTFDPLWSPEKVSKEAKEELGLTENSSQKAVEKTFERPLLQESQTFAKEPICFNCSVTDKQKPLLSCRYQGENVYICSQCLSKF